MAKKRKRLDPSSLRRLPTDLRLASLALDPPRLEGFAYRFTLVIPLLSESGDEVFTDDDLRILAELFDHSFGGCLVSANLSNPAWFGSYLPAPEARPVKDYHTLIVVYTKQIDAADEYFQHLKDILKKAGFQDEVLIERIPVWLVGSANP